MKKWIAMMMTAVLVSLTAAGCGGTNTGAASATSSEPKAEAIKETEPAAEAEAGTRSQPEPEVLPVPEADEEPAPEAVAEEMKAAPADAAEPADGENAGGQEEAQPGEQGEGQADADSQAGTGATAEIAQAVEESRVPQAIRDLIVGEWHDMTSQRAGMEITDGDEAGGKDFHAQIFWSSSYQERTVWDMDLEYDPVSGELTYKRGRKAEVTYGADGMVANEEVQWEDAEGTFTLADGALRWKDSKQEDAGDFVLVRVYAYDITAEEFTENLFRVLIRLESGTAGSSLKEAKTAEEILAFAAGRQLWNVDAIARRAAITAAWDALSDEDKKLVKQNFGDKGGVAGLIDDAFKDYESVKGSFEDAGVGDEMKALSVNIYAKRSWKTLRELVLNLE